MKSEKKKVKFEDESFKELKNKLEFTLEELLNSIRILIEKKVEVVIVDTNEELKEWEVLMLSSDLKGEDQFVLRLHK